jgi:hypothetical protein
MIWKQSMCYTKYKSLIKLDLIKLNFKTMNENHEAAQPVDVEVKENSIKYEIVDKTTHVSYPVTGITFGQDYTEVISAVGTVRFSNVEQKGNLENSVYHQMGPTQ